MDNPTLYEQIFDEDLTPLEEQLTIINSLDGQVINEGEINYG